jgi:hypothetical protein
MALYFSGSDGNVYCEPYNGQFTGSLYKTKFLTITEDPDDDESTVSVPGILYDTGSNAYWSSTRWSVSSLMDSSVSFDTGSMQGCVWVYNLNEASKSRIESDADWIATYVTSSL